MTDRTIEAFVVALGNNSPWFVLVIGILAITAALAAKIFPLWKEIQIERMQLKKQEEVNKAKELELAAQAIEQNKRSTAAIEASTVQSAVLASQVESFGKTGSDMTHKVDNIDTTTRSIAVKVDDIHMAMLTSRD